MEWLTSNTTTIRDLEGLATRRRAYGVVQASFVVVGWKAQLAACVIGRMPI